MATDCKSVGESLPWFKSMFHHHFFKKADLAQQAEHIHGKDGVFGSNPKIGSIFLLIRNSRLIDLFLWGLFFVYKNKFPMITGRFTKK